EAAAKRQSLQYTMESTTTQTSQGQKVSSRNAKASVTAVSPAKYRVEEVDGSGPGARTHVSDGATSWDYIVAARQYTKSSAGQRVNLFGIATLDWFGGPAASDFQGKPTLLREETVEVDGKKYDCLVVTDGLKPG